MSPRERVSQERKVNERPFLIVTAFSPEGAGEGDGRGRLATATRLEPAKNSPSTAGEKTRQSKNPAFPQANNANGGGRAGGGWADTRRSPSGEAAGPAGRPPLARGPARAAETEKRGTTPEAGRPGDAGSLTRCGGEGRRDGRSGNESEFPKKPRRTGVRHSTPSPSALSQKMHPNGRAEAGSRCAQSSRL